MSVTDPFDTVREAISVYHVASGKKEEAHAALASIEERIAELGSELTDSEINFRDQLDRARAAERERDDYRARVEHFRSDPLVVALEAAERERDDTISLNSSQAVWIAELREALREIERISMDDPAELVDELRSLARAALATSEQATEEGTA
jgi:signal transduction histidine kinase